MNTPPNLAVLGVLVVVGLMELGQKSRSLLFVSARATDAGGGAVGDGVFERQVEQVFVNLARLLRASGSGLDQVVKLTVYLTDMNNLPAFMHLRRQYFTPPYPVHTIVGVDALTLQSSLIEVEAVALCAKPAPGSAAP